MLSRGQVVIVIIIITIIIIIVIIIILRPKITIFCDISDIINTISSISYIL